jgi:hypothetical protein
VRFAPSALGECPAGGCEPIAHGRSLAKARRAGERAHRTPARRSRRQRHEDESEAIVLERFRDADALILHSQNMAPLMESIMATGTVSGELLGDLTDELRAQMAGSPVGLFTLYQSL